jgi:predicted PilT family ATPase
MKRFVVAYTSLFINVTQMYEVLATSELAALSLTMVKQGYTVYDDISTVEEMKQFAFDCDAILGIIAL